MSKLLTLHKLLENLELNNDNLHRIAISNIDDTEKTLARWWTKKYERPLKAFEDHTHEELIIEMLEDFYDKNRVEVDRFYDTIEEEKRKLEYGEWNGQTSKEYEEQVKKILSKRKPVDISKYQSEGDMALTQEQTDAIFDSIGRNLPKSKVVRSASGLGIPETKTKEEKEPPILGDDLDDFDDDFGVTK